MDIVEAQDNEGERKIKKNSFFKDIMTLTSGSIVSKVVVGLFSIIIARVYAPNDFGTLSIFTTLIVPATILCTLHYEIAIMLSSDDEEAETVTILCFSITVIFSGILFFILLFLKDQVLRFLGYEALGNLVFLVPLTILSGGLSVAMSSYLNRSQQYKKIAFSSVSNGITSSIMKLSLGWFRSGSIGLVWGYVSGSLASLIVYRRSLVKLVKKIRDEISYFQLKTVAIKFKSFPLILTWGTFAASFSSQFPAFFINKYYGSSQLGMYSLAYSIISLVSAAISDSVSRVVFKKITELYHHKRDLFFKFILKTSIYLILIVVMGLFVIKLSAASAIVIIFGEKWRMAGQLSFPVACVLGVRFIVAPLTNVLSFEEFHLIGVLWKILYMLTLAFVAYNYNGVGVYDFVVLLAFHDACLYTFYYLVILFYAKKVS